MLVLTILRQLRRSPCRGDAEATGSEATWLKRH